MLRKLLKCLGPSLLVLSLWALPAWAQSYAPGAQVQVEWKGKWWPAVVKSHDAGRACWNIHYEAYGDDWDECVGQARIRPRDGGSGGSGGGSAPIRQGAPAFPDGSPVSVEWKGQWWDATVKRYDQGGACWHIHYDGYGDEWDECVGQARIRHRTRGGAPANPYPNGSKVQVLWKDKWWGAQVRLHDRGKGCWLIRYDGYGAEWDECVGPQRIKPR